MDIKISSLIISPHADDEVLGCFSFLSDDTFVIYLGIEDRSYVSRTERINEVNYSAKKSGFKYEILDFCVNNYQVSPLIPEIERVVNSLKPQTVLIPQPSYNQDHRAVYDASLTALRPHDKNWLVPNVLIYEQPDSILWSHGQESEPNLFREINIEDKLDSYALYASQVRGHRSPSLIRSMAQLRGAQSGLPFAEGFTVKRIVKRGV
jgi:N-acetylglucosamine malate deacetylase 1